MRVQELAAEHEDAFVHCLEEYSDEMRESGELRRRWLGVMRQRGLRAQVAIDDDGALSGMIQYGPCEDSDVDAPGLYFVYCVWVHGHERGPGNRQGRGIGTALLTAAENDVMALGAQGLVAWGLRLPFWMRASWFKKHGYRSAQRRGMAELVWKRFAVEARPPRWREQHVKLELAPGKVSVTACNNGWCAGRNVAYERARRASEELGDGVEYRWVDTTDRETLRACGCMDALFIDDKQLNFGPPPAYERLRKKIAKRLKKAGKS